MATPSHVEFPDPPHFESGPDWVVQDEVVVEDPAAVQLMSTADSRRYLLPFMGRAATVSVVAAHLKVKPQAMQYWVGRLVQAGLLRVWGVERRGRHRVQWYRCVAHRLRLGLADLPVETHEDVLHCVSERFERLARRSIAQSLGAHAHALEMTVDYQAAAGSSLGVQARPGQTVVDDYVSYWARLWLSVDEEGALRQELDSLWDRFAALSRRAPGRVPVLFNLTQVRDRSI